MMNGHGKSDRPVVPAKSPNNGNAPRRDTRHAAPGVDGQTWRAYGQALEENLRDLSARLKRGAYRAKPVRRVYIAKADGRQRPLGVPVLEDKLVQRATVMVLNAIYETDFLGFSHICGKKRSNGRFTVLRQTMRSKLRAKLNAVKAELRRRWHDPIPAVGQWLHSVVSGYIRYYGVPSNIGALATFRFQIGRLWRRAWARRSHKGRITWERMYRLMNHWLPAARICHPYPLRRMGVIT